MQRARGDRRRGNRSWRRRTSPSRRAAASRGSRSPRQLLQEVVALRAIFGHLAPDRAAPDDIVGSHLPRRNDAVLFEVLDDRVPDVGVVGRARLVVVVLLVVVERCERMQDRNRIRDALAVENSCRPSSSDRVPADRKATRPSWLHRSPATQPKGSAGPCWGER